jgi:hypothetical protein
MKHLVRNVYRIDTQWTGDILEVAESADGATVTIGILRGADGRWTSLSQDEWQALCNLIYRVKFPGLSANKDQG